MAAHGDNGGSILNCGVGGWRLGAAHWMGAVCVVMAMSWLRSGYISKSTPRRLHDGFWPNLHSGSVSEVPPRRLQLQNEEKGGKRLL